MRGATAHTPLQACSARRASASPTPRERVSAGAEPGIQAVATAAAKPKSAHEPRPSPGRGRPTASPVFAAGRTPAAPPAGPCSSLTPGAPAPPWALAAGGATSRLDTPRSRRHVCSGQSQPSMGGGHGAAVLALEPLAHTGRHDARGAGRGSSTSEAEAGLWPQLLGCSTRQKKPCHERVTPDNLSF